MIYLLDVNALIASGTQAINSMIEQPFGSHQYPLLINLLRQPLPNSDLFVFSRKPTAFRSHNPNKHSPN